MNEGVISDEEQITDCNVGSAVDVGLSRKNSAGHKNMVDMGSMVEDVIISNDEVIIGRSVIIKGPEEIAKKDFEDEGLSPPFCAQNFIPKMVSEDEWRDAAEQVVLRVHCKKITAELHKNRFGSGSKGRCIRCGDLWLTPREFEARCGKSASKDWKRSIRFQGITLNDLIENGYILVHASSCVCEVCLEDNLAAGPVRLYQHYKRRKKNSETHYKRCFSEPFETMQSATITIPVESIGLTRLSNGSVTSVSGSLPTAEVVLVTEDTFHNMDHLPLDKAWALMNQTLLDITKSTKKAREMLEELRQRTNKELLDQRRVLLQEKETAVQRAKLETQLAINSHSHGCTPAVILEELSPEITIDVTEKDIL